MAIRFINEVSTPYQSQYVPLPLEMMAKSNEASQLKYDTSLSKAQEDAFVLKDTPWTTNAQSVVEPYRQKQSEIVNNLMRTGKTGMALRDLKNLKEKYANDELVQNQIGWLEYAKNLEKQMQDPKWASAYDPIFYKEGDWNKIDLSSPDARQFIGKNPSPIYDENTEYIHKTIGEHLKGLAQKEGLIGEMKYDPNLNKYYYDKIDGSRHFITKDDPYTKQAIESMAELWSDPNLGTHPQQVYARGKKGLQTKDDFINYFEKVLSPYFNEQTGIDQTRTFQTIDPDGNGANKKSENDLLFLKASQSATTSGNTVQQVEDKVIEAHKIVRDQQQVIAENTYNLFSKDKEFMTTFGSLLGINLKNFTEIPKADFNNKVSEILNDRSFVPQYDSNGKVVSIKTKGEVLMEELSSFVLNKLSTEGISDSDKLHYSKLFTSIGQMQGQQETMRRLLKYRNTTEENFTDYFVENLDKMKDEYGNLDIRNIVSDFSRIMAPITRLVSKEQLEKIGLRKAGKEWTDKDLVKWLVTTDDPMASLVNLSEMSKNEWNLSSSGMSRSQISRNLLDIKQAYFSEKAVRPASGAIENGSYLISLGEPSKNPAVNFEKALKEELRLMTNAQLAKAITGNEEIELKAIFGNKLAAYEMDPDFNPDEAHVSQIEKVNLDLNAVDGLHYIVTFKQGKESDDKTNIAKVRVKLDGEMKKSFNKSVIVPMLQSGDPGIVDSATSLLIQTNMDPEENALLRAITSTPIKGNKVYEHDFDFNIDGQYGMTFKLIKNSSGTILKDADTGKLYPVSDASFNGVLELMGRSWFNQKVDINRQGGSGGSSTGKPNRPRDGEEK